MQSKIFSLMGICAFLIAAQNAHAGLIGLTIGSTLETQFAGGWTYGNSAVVGSGIEFTKEAYGTDIVLTLDVKDTSFTLTYYNNFPDQGQGAFNLGLLSINLTGLNAPEGPITKVERTFSIFHNGLGDPTFTSNSITLPITTLLPPGEYYTATYDITFGGTQPTTPSATPEPTSLGLLGGGLGVLAAGLRLRRRACD